MPILDGYAFMYEMSQKPHRPVVVFISDETTQRGHAGFNNNGNIRLYFKTDSTEKFAGRIKKKPS